MRATYNKIRFQIHEIDSVINLAFKLQDLDEPRPLPLKIEDKDLKNF